MKKVVIYFLAFLTALSVQAQQNRSASDVTIIVNGNRSLQLFVDGKDYNLINDAAKNRQATITINNMVTGQHTLVFVQKDNNLNRSDRFTASFSLRHKFDMLVRLNGNGSLELIETKNTGIDENHVPMNSSSFNYLYRNVSNQRTTNGRRTLIYNAFTTTNNYYTTSQVSQLLRLVSAENYRLELAKLSYPLITDRNNFNQLYTLLNSQASRNELEDYADNYNEDIEENNDTGVAMSDANFNRLFNTIQQQWPVSTQMSTLSNAFNNSTNQFSTNQASRLIQLINTENNRLILAKLSYRSITDRNNFNQLYNLLSSQSSRNELTTYINNYNGNNNSTTAMTTGNFNYLFQSIQQQWPLSAQLNLLTNAFTSPDNYFTTDQASRLIQIVNTDNNRLPLAKLSYRSITDRNNFNQVYNLFSSQNSKNELTTYVNNYRENNNDDRGMTDANFNSLYQNIQQQWPVNNQINLLTSTFNNTNNYFTSFQASRLIQLVTGENNRLPLAKLSFRSITDPANFNLIADLLNTQSGKNELAAYVNNYSGGGIGYKAPMTDANFTAFYQTLQVQFLPGEQMSSLTEAFNNQSYYFTTAQAKQLIPLVSYESNRLQLAKLSYRTITDRNNFNQLYDLLNSQSSRDELTAYVNGYKD